MQCFEEAHEGSSFCGTQIFSVRRHIAAALDHLSDQLIVCESDSDCIERRSTLSALAVECVAVVALLDLKDQRTLAFQCRALRQILRWDRFTTPCIHHWTPRCVASHIRERAECHDCKQNYKDCHRAASPALLTFTRYEWKREQHQNCNRWSDEHCGCF